jgi:SAM-dependent methyltransferase
MDTEPGERRSPVPLLCAIASTIPPGRALDLACGRGRNAIWLAQQGWPVTAVDVAPTAIAPLNTHRITAIAANLEAGEYQIEESAWDLIVISYYLQRDLFESAKAGLKPGGTIIAIVLTAEPGENPGPYQLRPGELVEYFKDFEILQQYEGPPHDDSRHTRVAEIAARKRAH